MRYWAQFYQRRQRPDGTFYYVEAIGDRQLIFLDGRWARARMELVANEECVARGYDGWRLARGERLERPFYLNAAVKEARK